MSESLLASLPRFDSECSGPSGLPETAECADGGLADMPAEPDALEEEPPGPDDCAADEAARLAEAQSELLASLETMLSELPEAISRLEDEIRQQTTRSMVALAEELFPKLSQGFLSEEIARHLPGLLAPVVEEVEIRTAPGAADILSTAIEHQAGDTAKYSVREDGQLAPGQVRISWKSGGFDYDFEDLLSACMRRLKSDERNTEEQE